MKRNVINTMVGVFVVVALGLAGCGGGGGSSTSGNSTTQSTTGTDITGDWTGIFLQASSTEAVPGYFVLTQSGNNVTGSFNSSQTVNGTVSGSNISLSISNNGSGAATIAATLSGNSMTGTIISGSSSGTATITKGFSDNQTVSLNYWPNSTDKWWLQTTVYSVKNPSRVYITTPYITGQYDLFNCGTLTGKSSSVQRWWSSNNAACTEGNNNAKLTSTPTLPFNVILHVVTASGETTITKTITSYTTN
jgi:hypothetical protein